MKSLTTLFCLVVMVFTAKAQFNFNYKEKLTPPNTDSARVANDQFGYAVAIDGNYAVVTARFQSYDSIGGNMDLEPGAAYVFERQSNNEWGLVKKLTPPSTNNARKAFDNFGLSAAISGNTIVVGATGNGYDSSGGNFKSGAGAAYIFERNNGNWGYVRKLTAPDANNGRNQNDLFGYSVAIDGNYTVIGAIYHDYDSNGNSFIDRAGAAYIFEKNNGTWGFVKKITPPNTDSARAYMDLFGWSVAIDSNYAIVGTERQDYDSAGGNYFEWAGAAYVFERNNSVWGYTKKLTLPNNDRGNRDFFGNSVALKGELAIIGAYGQDFDSVGGNNIDRAGAAYIYKRNSGSWDLSEKLTVPDGDSNRMDADFFGSAVDITDNYAIIGARNQDYDSAGNVFKNDAGAVYIFYRINNSWNYLKKLTPPNTNNNRNSSDWVGFSVGIDGESAITGAYFQDYDSSGNSYKQDAGAAYIFEWSLSDTMTDTLSSFLVVTPSPSSSYNLGGDTSTLPQLLFTWQKSTPKLGFAAPTYTLALDTTGGTGPFSIFNAGTDSFYVLSYANAKAFFNTYKKNDTLKANWYVIAETGSYSKFSDNKHSIIFYDSATNTGLIELQRQFKIYPNPANTTVKIESTQEFREIKIFDLAGKLVLEKKYNGEQRVELNLQEIPRGMYIVEVKTANGILSQKLEVKQ